MLSVNQTLIDVLDYIANISEVAYFVSLIHPLLLVYKKIINISDFPKILLILMFLNGFLWELFLLQNYGSGMFGWICNIFKTIIGWVYFGIYLYFYSKEKNIYYKVFCIILFSLLTITIIVLTSITHLLSSTALFWYAIAITIGMYIAPFENMEKLFISKNHKVIPIITSLILLGSSLIFVVKYIIQNDFTFIYADIIGVVANLIVSVIWGIYYMKYKDGNNTLDDNLNVSPVLDNE